jgi:hypothetical protein
MMRSKSPLAAVDRAHWKALNHERYMEQCMAQTLRPGVIELLDYADAHNITLAVGSSGDRAWVTKWLTHHNLIQRFAAVVTRDDVSQVKPSPEIFCSPPTHRHQSGGASYLKIRRMAPLLPLGQACAVWPSLIPALLDAWMPAVTIRLQSLADVTPAQLLTQVAGHASSTPHTM